jgi:transcriptional regulator with XRE-family HTH domain
MAVRSSGVEAPAQDLDLDLELGPRLRSLRTARGLTLRELAQRAGVTESFLSQAERGVATPSIASIQRIARGLGLSIADLFAEVESVGLVVRATERRRISYPGLGAVDEFLTRAKGGRLQVIMSTVEPGGGTGDEPYTHDSDEEVLIVLEGELDVWVGDEHFHLEAGDAVTHSSRLPHRNTNRGSVPARLLFCITPPSF